jgi:5'-nucleotidase
VPDLPLDEIKGIRVTRCGSRHPADQVIPQQDPRGNTLYWIGPPGDKCDAGPDTDLPPWMKAMFRLRHCT